MIIVKVNCCHIWSLKPKLLKLKQSLECSLASSILMSGTNTLIETVNNHYFFSITLFTAHGHQTLNDCIQGWTYLPTIRLQERKENKWIELLAM